MAVMFSIICTIFRRYGTIGADNHDRRCILGTAEHAHIRYVDMADGQDRRRLGDDARLVAMDRNQGMFFPI